MAHTIEPARSSRASCKTCKGKIEKGELRFGEEAPNPFMDGEMGYRWHHLKCAAKKKSDILLDTLDEIEIEVPEREELIALAKKAVAERGSKLNEPTKSRPRPSAAPLPNMPRPDAALA